MKIFVDCFSVNTIGTKSPEASHECFSIEEVNAILEQVSKVESGIKKVEIWFDRSTERISKD